MHLAAGSLGAWGAFHHPPLLFYWLWLATLVSDQEWWLRLVPAIAGGLTPLFTGLWLRRFVSPLTAWGLAALVAVAPNLVLLGVQLRGYSMAMLGTVTALYALDRALEERCRRWMVWHFVALYGAILAEFSAAWVVLAAGLYGMARLWRELETRRVLGVWVGGQCGAAALYGAIYVWVMVPLLQQGSVVSVVKSYLAGAFPREGEWLPLFVAKGAVKQFSYILGGEWAGILGIVAAGVGILFWWKRGDMRWVLAIGVHLAAAGAILEFYPYGRSRHTVLIGLVGLGAVGAGLEALGAVRKWVSPAVVGVFFALLLTARTGDIHNIPMDFWDKELWEVAMERVEYRVPPGATVLADRETLYMLGQRYFRREERRLQFPEGIPIVVRGWRVIPRKFSWTQERPEEIRAALNGVGGPVWILDMGFDGGTVSSLSERLEIETVVEEPGIVYLGRVR